ncbi:MAG: VCBS repeat-containing protein [Planctomycetales bacterium]|nr:VCBS repeat-containing protein [Planctomycetales bacterium]
MQRLVIGIVSILIFGIAAYSVACWMFGLDPRSIFGIGSDVEPQRVSEATLGDPLSLFRTMPIGRKFEEPPKISYLQIIDLNRDGLQDIVVCDCAADTVSWLQQLPSGEFEEKIIASELIAPARVACVDFDRDNDIDVFVAYLGKLNPSNEKIGSLVGLENDGQQNFTSHLLLSEVARISDVRCADIDADTDLDLVVCQFGYHQGECRWLENVGTPDGDPWQFESHTLMEQPGGIHAIPGDFNDDQLQDIAILLSQEIEQVRVLVGTGKGEFRDTLAYDAGDPDFGSSGIWVWDLDRDGDQDILYSNGDAFDYSPPQPWPWHGLQWLENQGNEQFRYHRLADFGGAVNMQVADFDNDGDWDIFASSTFNDWHTPESQSLLLLENTDNMQFVIHPLANTPSHIQAIAVGDVNSDGKLDLVSGGMHVSEPYDRVERILLWLGNDEMPSVSTARSTP